MKNAWRTGFLGIGAGAILITACSGGGTDNSGEQATIDEAVATELITALSDFLPACRIGGVSLSQDLGADPAALRTVRLARFLIAHTKGRLRTDGGRANFLPPSQPDDEFGDCGGRITFPSYSHSNGTTTGTVEFENYCTLVEQTGDRAIADGQISFADRGTPGASGPVTNEFAADSPDGVVTETRTGAGALLTSNRTTFQDFLYDVGVPDELPTSSNPDRVTLADARFTDLLSGTTYRQSNFTYNGYVNGSGDNVISYSGRSYLANGEYFNVATTQPITLTDEGEILAGQVTFTGAEGTSLVITLVPGVVPQATFTVNGTPVTNVPACQ